MLQTLIRTLTPWRETTDGPAPQELEPQPGTGPTSSKEELTPPDTENQPTQEHVTEQPPPVKHRHTRQDCESVGVADFKEAVVMAAEIMKQEEELETFNKLWQHAVPMWREQNPELLDSLADLQVCKRNEDAEGEVDALGIMILRIKDNFNQKQRRDQLKEQEIATAKIVAIVQQVWTKSEATVARQQINTTEQDQLKVAEHCQCPSTMTLCKYCITEDKAGLGAQIRSITGPDIRKPWEKYPKPQQKEKENKLKAKEIATIYRIEKMGYNPAPEQWETHRELCKQSTCCFFYGLLECYPSRKAAHAHARRIGTMPTPGELAPCPERKKWGHPTLMKEREPPAITPEPPASVNRMEMSLNQNAPQPAPREPRVEPTIEKKPT